MRRSYRFSRLAAVGTILAMAGPASAQDAPTPAPQDTAVQAPPPAPTGPEWWVFSRSTQRSYLIDVNSIARTGDELTVKIARLPRQGEAQDYSHTEDVFGIRCAANQSHVDRSMDVLEDGEPTEDYATDEPWDTIRAGTLDEGVHEIACDNGRPPGPSFPSVKAYIDAGRP